MVEFDREYTPEGLSFYDFLCRETADYKLGTALSFYGMNITYQELFRRIDEAAKALIAWGVKRNDVVASSLPGIPEGIYLLYAINKIGAVYCAFDCRAKKDEIYQMLETFSPKLCIVPDFQIMEFIDVQDCPVIYINPANALGEMGKIHSILADFFTGRTFLCAKNANIFSYYRFIQRARDGENNLTQKADDNIFGYFYTSGTTYGRKSIILTNENINAAVEIQRASNPDIAAGESMLNIMPLFTCYSVTLAVHLPLSCGVCVNLIPLVKPQKMKKVLLRAKPNYIITVPAHWEYFIRGNFRHCDLSFMKKIIVGGDTMNPIYRQKLREIFEACGAEDPIMVGYGLSETTSTATSAQKQKTELVGNVGSTLPFMKVAICDPETGENLPFGKKGEICICGPTLCRGYFREEELTRKLLRIHEDGRLWLHSGDCGYLDETGALFFCERYKRMYVRFDGTKISPYSVEQVIKTCPAVEACMLIAIADIDHSHGMCGKALVVLKKENEKNGEDQVRRFCRKNLDVHMQPKQIVIVDRLPHTKNGKLDYFGVCK